MQAAIGTYSFTERQLNQPTTETVEGEDRVEQFFTDAVICNSPTKGIIWRVKNDYPGSCTTELYSRLLALGEKVLRSNSVPLLSPVRPNQSDHDQPEPQNDVTPIQLYDTDEG
jgi:hypothetical protein